MKVNKVLIILESDHDLATFQARVTAFLSPFHPEIFLLVKTKTVPTIMRYALGQNAYDELQVVYNDKAEQMIDLFEEQLSHGDWSLNSDIFPANTQPERILAFIVEKKIDWVIMPGNIDKNHNRLHSDQKHLIRLAPVPVWLLQHVTNEPECKVLGAVDVPVHHGKPESLNHDIIKASNYFAELFNTENALINVYPNMPEDIIEQHEGEVIEDYVKRIRDHQREPLNALAEHYNFARHQVHFEQGDADYEICQHIKKHQFDLLVLGTVGRYGFEKFLYGSVAEKLIDHVDCDIIALKPGQLN